MATFNSIAEVNRWLREKGVSPSLKVNKLVNAENIKKYGRGYNLYGLIQSFPNGGKTVIAKSTNLNESPFLR